MANRDSRNYIMGFGESFYGPAGAIEHMGNMSELTTNVDIETLEHYSNMSKTKQLDFEEIVSTTPALACVLDESSATNLSWATLGEKTDIAQTTATDEAIVSGLITKKGCILDLGKKNITSITFTTPAAPTEGDDYLLHEIPGWLYIPFDSTIPDLTEIAGTISYGDQDYSTIEVFTQPSTEGIFKFFNSRKLLTLTYWRVTWKVSGDLAFIGADDILKIPLEGKILADQTNHPTNPFGIMERGIIT